MFPFGTGNALFNSIHKSTKYVDPLKRAIETLFNGEDHLLPTFMAGFSNDANRLERDGSTLVRHKIPNGILYGVVVASWGLHASLVSDSDTPEWRKEGADRFVKVTQELVKPKDGSSTHVYRGRVKVDEQYLERINTSLSPPDPFEHNHGYVLATLVSDIANGFTISPESKPLDNQIRLVYFGALDNNATWDMMIAASTQGSHVQSASVRYTPIKSLAITMEEDDDKSQPPQDHGKWRRVCIDGMIVELDKGGVMRIELVSPQQRSLRVVAPRGAVIESSPLPPAAGPTVGGFEGL